MTIMHSRVCPSVKDDECFFRVNAATGKIKLLCPARGIAGLHGHYKAINHINRAKEAGPEGVAPVVRVRTVKSTELSITQTFEFPADRPTIRSHLSIIRSVRVRSCSSFENHSSSCATYIVVEI